MWLELEALEQCRKLAERFGFEVEDSKEELKALNAAMAQAMCTVTEAVLMSILSEKTLTVEIKRTKIKKQFDKLSAASRKYHVDIKMMLLPRIAKDATSKVLS